MLGRLCYGGAVPAGRIAYQPAGPPFVVAARRAPVHGRCLGAAPGRRGGISSVGSHPLGFRATGTPEEHEVAELVAAEMRSIGLADVRFEYVPVHAWRFRGASVAVEGGASLIDCSSLAGARGTRGSGVSGEVVMVGDGRRARLDRVDLGGKIALLDWRPRAAGIAEMGLELAGRGVRAIVAVCLDGAQRFQGPDALGTGVGRWYDGAPPIVIPRARDGAALIDRCRAGTVRATVTVYRRDRPASARPKRRRRARQRSAGRADRGRRPPRRLVLRRVRQRQRCGRHARARPGADRGGMGAEPPGVVRLAHGRGVRVARP